MDIVLKIHIGIKQNVKIFICSHITNNPAKGSGKRNP